MKKLLFKLAGVTCAAALSLSAFSSCGLFTVNKDMDMARTAATVQIDKSVDAENIYKRDIFLTDIITFSSIRTPWRMLINSFSTT